MQAGKLVEQDQDETKVTYAKLIKKEDGLINWTLSGVELDRQIKALNPWPGTFAKTARGTLKIHKAKYHSSLSGAPLQAEPSDIFTATGNLYVCCADGWMELLSVQPEGGKIMSTQEYMNGMRNNDQKLFV